VGGQSAVVADVGGTSVRFAVATVDEDGPVTLTGFAKHPTKGATFHTRLRNYLDGLAAVPSVASICAAGPVADGKVELLNNGWTIDAAAEQAAFGFDQVVLLNDFAAMARSAPLMNAEQKVRLSDGQSVSGSPIVVGGPGTGFGMALLVPAPGGWTIVSGEGGHRAFAPQTAFEWEMLRVFRRNSDYVSVEDIAGGKALERVYSAVCAVLGQPVTQIDARSIRLLARSGDPACATLCQLRANTTMTVLGDAALMAGAMGGCVIAGGEAVRLRGYMASDEAIGRFRRRGPRTEYLSQVPIDLIVSEEAPLTGAAAVAFEMS
jgi:glucokinase